MAVITAYQLQAEALVEQLRVTLKAIAHFDAEIATTAAKLPDYALLFKPAITTKTIPGIAKRIIQLVSFWTQCTPLYLRQEAGLLPVHR